MKRFSSALVLVLVLLAISTVTNAATDKLTFQWDPNTESDLKGYRLYRSATPGTYTYVGKNSSLTPANPPASYVISVAKPDVTADVDISAPDGSTVYFVLTAFDASGNESGPSNQVSHVMSDSTPPSPPKTFKAILKQILSAIREWWLARR